MATRRVPDLRAPFTLFVIILLLGISACSGGDGEGGKGANRSRSASPGASAPVKPIAVRYSAWGRQGRIELLALDRVAGKAVVAQFRIVNDTDQEYPVGSSLSGSIDRKQARSNAVDLDAISGVSLLDKKNSRQHFPLNREDGQCLCSRYHTTLPAKQSHELLAAFPAPPQDVKSMGVLFPHAPPFLDVPLKDVPAQSYLFGDSQGQQDPSKVKTVQPLILPVISTVERGEDGEDDDGRNLNVRLSTDVLFATNKSDLNTAAQGRLRAVAAQIDKSKGTVVKVDGHTDTTGNDAINDPLSQRRAEAVKDALAGLVTRTGVTFQAQGHGSKQPVASNENAGGRQKNRRVTVSFARPAPPAPPASSGGQAQSSETWPRPVLARTTPKSDPASKPLGGWPKGLTVEINTLSRDASGFAVLVFTVVNPDGSVKFNTSAFAAVDGLYNGEAATGVSLVSGDRRMRVLRADDRVPVGTSDFGIFGPGERFDVAPKGRLTVWSTFKIPSDITTVDVQFEGFNPARNVPIK